MTDPPSPLRVDPDAGAGARTMLLEIYRAVGRIEGAQTEHARTVADIHERVLALEAATSRDQARRAMMIALAGGFLAFTGWTIGIAASIGFKPLVEVINRGFGL